MENPNAQLTPDGCFSLSHTWQLILHSRKSQPGWSSLNKRRDKETYAPNQFRHEGIVRQLRDLIKLPLYFPHYIPKHCPPNFSQSPIPGCTILCPYFNRHLKISLKFPKFIFFQFNQNKTRPYSKLRVLRRERKF